MSTKNVSKQAQSRNQRSYETTLDQDDHELQIILAEFDHQREKIQSSIETVNQTLTIYIAVLAILAPIAGAIAVFSQNPTVNPLVMTCMTALAAVASTFTLFCSYKARIEQTYAEKGLSRVCNFFATRYPNIRSHLFGIIYDDWPTPFSHRWKSLTFYGWLSFIIASGFFTFLSMLFFLVFVGFNRLAWWVLPSLLGFTVILLEFIWLNRRLNGEFRAFTPNFPRVQNKK